MRRWMVWAVLAGCGGAPDVDEADEVYVFPALDPMPLDASVEAEVTAWLDDMSLEERVAQMHGEALIPVGGLWSTPDNERLGIRGFRMVDGPRGLTAGQATAMPVAMARAASWDLALEEEVGAVIGRETRAVGGDVLLAPAINVLHHPAWGRAQETYGEDPFLLGAMGTAFVHGAQTHVLASAKHFVANSIEDTRFDVNITVDERTLREVYGRAFRQVVREGGVASVMSAYNKVNGLYCAENPHLLTRMLRQDWGFAGFVESDWALGTRSTAPSVAAGLDIEMPAATFYGSTLVAMVGTGAVPEAQVDAAVRRILRQKVAFDIAGAPRPDRDQVGGPAHAEVARRAAARGMVLLRNEALLPLGDDARLAVVGALSDVPNLGDVGSSDVRPGRVVTPWEGLAARFGLTDDDRFATDTPDAQALAAIGSADVAVVVVGLTAEDEGENIEGRPGGDRETLSLSATQQALLDAVTAVNDAVVVVVQGGSAVVLPASAQEASAVLMSWYAGQEGGHALADLLSGDVEPVGRLPLSFPVDDDQLGRFDATSLEVTYGPLHGYTLLQRDDTAPAYAFGFGLGYHTVALSDAVTTVRGEGVDAVVDVVVSVDITSGQGPTEAVVQVYGGKADTSWPRADRRLVGFARVQVPPGGGVATVQVPAHELAVYDPGREAWVLERGTHTLWVGQSSEDRDIVLDVTL